jgi:hypothetical protein
MDAEAKRKIPALHTKLEHLNAFSAHYAITYSMVQGIF